VADAYNLELKTGIAQLKGYDAVHRDGLEVEIKAIRNSNSVCVSTASLSKNNHHRKIFA